MLPASVDPAGTAGECGAVHGGPMAGLPSAVLQELDAVLKRAKDGDVESLPELRRILDQHPELWRAYADLSGHVERRWIDLLSGHNLCLKESLARNAAALRSELAEGADSLAAKLLIDRVVSSWLEVQYFAVAATMVGPDVPPRQATYMQGRSAAQRRHVAAIKTLTEVRRLTAGRGGPECAGRQKATRRSSPSVSSSGGTGHTAAADPMAACRRLV
jgi:hypothetical protein